MSKITVNEISPNTKPGVGIGGSSNDPSAIFNLQSTSQGFLAPRMTTAQRDAISTPSEGLLVYNLDDGRLEQYSSGQWTVVGNGQAPVAKVLRVVKNPVLNSQDFATINDALVSITGNSPSNPYLISVGPGVFVEQPIQMKSYVWVEGSGPEQTIIQAANPNAHLITGADFSGISKCLLEGATGPSFAAIFYQSTFASTQAAFWVEQIRFGSNDTLAIADGLLGNSNLFLFDCRFGSVYSFNHGFLARNTNTFRASIVMRSGTTTALQAPYPDYLFWATGPNSEILLNSGQFRVEAANSIECIRVSDGAHCRVLSVFIRGFGTGIHMDGTAAGTELDCDAVHIESSINWDVLIDNPNAFVSFEGVANRSKISVISSATDVKMAFLDEQTGDIVITGRVLYAKNIADVIDITLLGTESATMGVMDGGELTSGSGFTVNISAGFGYLEIEPEIFRQFFWGDISITLPPNQALYLIFDNTGALTTTSTFPDTHLVILLGRVVTNSTGIEFIDSSGIDAEHSSNRYDDLFRNAIGGVFSSGSIVTENGTRQLDVTPGTYYLATNRFMPSGATAVSWTAYYQNGTGGFSQVSQNVVDNAFFDNGTGTLAPIGAGNFAKHVLYLVGEGINEKYLLVYSQVQYTALTLAEQGPRPTPPPYFLDGVVPIASLIVQQGMTNIIEIRDERPRVGSAPSSVSAASFHRNLLGLTVGDDHPQYWRNDGTHVATGDFNLGTHNITNLGTANGVVVENHHARHQPGGADEIPTAAAVTLNPDQANAPGTSTSLARADHIHNVPTAAAVGLNSASTNTQGASTSFARADHTHAIASGVPSTQTPNQTNAAGASINFAKADHVHNIPTGAPSALTPNAGNSQGSAAAFAQQDHIHNVPTAVPANQTIAASSSDGVAASFSRSDHLHTFSTAAAATQTPDQLNADGSSINFARADHVHNIPTAAAGGLNANSTNTQGSAASFARSDHTHAISSGVVSTQNADQSNNAGTSANFARADHVHNIPTAAPTDIGSANSQGVATTLAKSDHVHKGVHSLKAGTGGTQRFGDLSIDPGKGTTVTDDGSGNFTVDTTIGPNELLVSQGAGLVANYTAGKARINGTTISISAGSITVVTGATNGRIYVDVDGVIKSTTSTSTPPNAVPLAIFSSNGAAITALSDNRTLLNVNLMFGSSSDIHNLTPDLSASAGSTNKYADAGHVHNVPTATVNDTGIANDQGSAASFARSDHVHNTVISNNKAASTSSATTSSASNSAIASMTVTPVAGTYVVFFEGVFSNSVNNALTTFSIYSDASQISDSIRIFKTQNNLNLGCRSTAVITVNGSNVITAQWNTSTGTSTIVGRSLMAIRVGS
jgi:hypothetical protein